MPKTLPARLTRASVSAALAAAALVAAVAPSSAAVAPSSVSTSAEALRETECDVPGQMVFNSGLGGWSRCFIGVGDLDAAFHMFAKATELKSANHAGWFTYENKAGVLKTQYFEKYKTYTGEFTTLKHIHVNG
ncbi:hypothetical protein ACIBRY_18025 [Streptomyces anulatus]